MSRPSFHAALLLALPLLAAGQVRFSATTERTKIAMGEQVLVVATLVTAKQLNLPVPRVPSSSDFTVLKSNSRQSSSSSIQIINGKTIQKNEITTSFYYYIAPRATGSFTFPSLSVNVEGATYTTSPISFTVTDKPVTNPDIRAFLTLSRRTLYTGEQTILTFKVAQRAQAQGTTDVRNGFNGALNKIEEAFGKDFALTRLFTNQVSQSNERIDGEMYTVLVLRFALFPLASGSFTIPSIPFEYQELRRSRRRRLDPFFDDIFGGNIFGGGVQATPKTVFSGAFTLKVKPLPPPPDNFSGAVGSFTLRAAADPLDVPAGESVTLKVTLRGTTRPGNVADISVAKRDDYELFAPEKQLSVDTGNSGISTRKTFKYLLIPRNEGTLTLEPVTYTYFDPRKESYLTATTEPIVLNVTKGKGGAKEQTRYLTQEEIREVGKDIRYIKTDVILRHQSRHPYREPLFYLLFPLPVVFVLLSLLYRLQSTHRDRTIALQLRNRALAAAHRQITRLRKQSGTLSPGDFLGNVAGTIEEYISRKFGFAATGRTLDELRDELLRSTSDEKTVSELAVFIEEIDSYRFGGASLDDASRDRILDTALRFLNGLDKNVKKRKKI